MSDQILEEINYLECNTSTLQIFNIFDEHDAFVALYKNDTNTRQKYITAVNENHEQEASFDLPINILLVEDDPVTRWMVAATMKNTCNWIIAHNIDTAIKSYQRYKPHMVMLDINLLDDSGYDVMAKIIQQDPKAYIVMFSSHDSLENIVKTIQEGAHGFITKPFSKEKIIHYASKCALTR